MNIKIARPILMKVSLVEWKNLPAASALKLGHRETDGQTQLLHKALFQVHATAQVIIRWLTTAEARVRS
jgi:hypothetical protein